MQPEIYKTYGSSLSSNTGSRILTTTLPTTNRNRNRNRNISLSLHTNCRLLTRMPIPIYLANPTWGILFSRLPRSQDIERV